MPPKGLHRNFWVWIVAFGLRLILTFTPLFCTCPFMLCAPWQDWPLRFLVVFLFSKTAQLESLGLSSKQGQLAGSCLEIITESVWDWPFLKVPRKSLHQWSCASMVLKCCFRPLPCLKFFIIYTSFFAPPQRADGVKICGCQIERRVASLSGRSPLKNCKNDLDDQSWQELE